MERNSRSGRQGKGSLQELMRERVQRIIEVIVEQELEEALGAASSARGDYIGVNDVKGYRRAIRRQSLDPIPQYDVSRLACTLTTATEWPLVTRLFCRVYPNKGGENRRA